MKHYLFALLCLSVCAGCSKQSSLEPASKTSLKANHLSVSGLPNYYVNAATGNDTNSGLSATSALKTIQAGLNKTTEGAGATIYVAAGTYSERLNWPHSGASGAPITLTNYDDGVVSVDGSTTSSSLTPLLNISSKSYIRIDHINFTNNIQAYAKGIYIAGSGTDVQVTYCEITNVGWTAWTTNASDPTSPTDNANPFIVVGTGSNSYNQIYVGSNKVYNCSTGYSEGLTLAGNVEIFLLENNTIHDVPNIGMDMNGHYSWTGAPAAVNYVRSGNVKHNTVYNCFSKVAPSGGIYVDGGAYINIEGNTSYGNGVGISIGCENNNNTADNINIRDNFIYNNVHAGMVIGANPSNSKVTNSTISNNSFFQNVSKSDYDGEIDIQNTDHLNIINNIVQSRSDVVVVARQGYTSTNLTMDYNNYYTASGTANTIIFDWGGINGQGYYSLASFQSALGLDLHSTYALPGFVTASLPTPDLHLTRSATACINKGLPSFTAAPCELDIDNQARVQNSRVDIGADETPY